MIGYLKPINPAPSEQRLFRAYQCALCHSLGEEYGLVYRLFAGPDLVFYNVLADLAATDLGAAAEPEVGGRACVVNPLGARGKQLPTMKRTENTRLAAAFGVYMSVEKLRDNFVDDGGLLRWLAWRALTPGRARARRVLAEHGFPLSAVDEQMAEQVGVEARAALPFAEAAAPTVAIARASFGHAGRDASEDGRAQAERIGQHIGGFLFAFDNLLDLPRDERDGSYNPIRRAGAQAREQALAAARAHVEQLGALANGLPFTARGRYVRQVASGFRHKLHRYGELTERERARATLRSLERRPFDLRRSLTQSWGWLQVAAALVVAFFVPKSAWAAEVVANSGVLAAAAETGDTGVATTDGSSSGGCFCNNVWSDPCGACCGCDSCGSGTSCGDGLSCGTGDCGSGC